MTAMEKKVRDGEAVDLSECARNKSGDFILDTFDDDMDYCVLAAGSWIWSIGRDLKTGSVLASTTGKFYQNPEYECLWLR